ncbi:AAA-like domain-containing protein [bacterium]|nr:AAA-like domain-containing protein [bacterium]
MSAFKKPNRFFENSGEVNPDISYFVPMTQVTNTKNQDMKTMVDLGRYFSIFAPRQSGKTTFFEQFCKELEKDITYLAIMLNFQACRSLEKIHFYQGLQKEIYQQLLRRLEEVQCEKLAAVEDLLRKHTIVDHGSFKNFFEDLNSLIPTKKIVIFIDEFDGIPIAEIENFLTTLRSLYQKFRGVSEKALYSVGLVGIRNIAKLILGGVSPFNIADKVKLPPFSLENIRDLYQEYTEETNQPFTEEAVQKIYQETAGQPWLVNWLGSILTVRIKPETVEPITSEDVAKAIELLLKDKNDHFDNLFGKAELYKETFIEIIFNGVAYDPDDKEQSFLESYGLIKEQDTMAVVFNNIYQSRFTKTFFKEFENQLDSTSRRYLTKTGDLDMEKILSEFEEYIMEIGVNAFHETKKPYEKTGQFLLTAWLYQFVKGKEYASLRYEIPSGVGRMDILLTYRAKKYIVETKIYRSPRTIEKAIDQLSEKYLATERIDRGFVVLFDPQTQVGKLYSPQKYEINNKIIVSFKIAIGRMK